MMMGVWDEILVFLFAFAFVLYLAIESRGGFRIEECS